MPDSVQSLRPVLTPKMVAEHWGCSERHIYNMIARGELRAFKLGGKLVRIRREDVLAVETQIEETEQVDSATAEENVGQPQNRRPAAPRLDVLQRQRIKALRRSDKDR